MKSLIAAVILLSTSIGLSSPSTGNQSANQKCLQALLENKNSVTLTGDVHPYETLASILEDAAASGRAAVSVTNNCVEVSMDIYDCNLTIAKTLGSLVAETDIAYKAGIYGDGLFATLRSKEVYVSRGM